MINCKHAMVLAGGFGTRLQSLVSSVPKPLADVAGRPFLFYLLDDLKSTGIEKITLLTGYLADSFTPLLDSIREMGFQVSQTIESEPMGTAGALKMAADQLQNDEWVLVLNGDTFYDHSLKLFTAFEPKSDASILVGGFMANDRSRYGALHVDEVSVTLISYKEKSETGPGLVNGGLYMIKGSLIKELPDTVPLSMERDVLEKGEWLVEVCTLDGFFHDIGLPESYSSFFINRWIENRQVKGRLKSLLFHIASGGSLYNLTDLDVGDASVKNLNFKELISEKETITHRDLLFHSFPAGSSESRRIRQTGALIIHPEKEASVYGAADLILSASELKTLLNETVSHFLHDCERLFPTFCESGARQPALLLDRDGVLIEHVNYPSRKEDVVLIREMIPLLKLYQSRGWLLIVITNQSGIGRGYYDELAFRQVNLEMKKQLAQEGVFLDALFYSPYYKESTSPNYLYSPQSRKPGPELILKAKSSFQIHLEQSVMIGNRSSDLLAGYWAGVDDLLLFEPLSKEDSDQMLSASALLNLEFTTLSRDQINLYINNHFENE